MKHQWQLIFEQCVGPADFYQTMARYGPCIFKNWMMKEGPPATIWGGRWLSGQFSILMIESLLQRASSKGRLCRLGLSFKYSSSRFSSVPVLKTKQNSYFVKISLKKFTCAYPGHHIYLIPISNLFPW